MHEIYQPIKTEVGIISGRDAIYLDEIKLDRVKNSVRFTGELNGHLCSQNIKNVEWIKYSLTFLGILGFRMIELDFEDFRGLSSFDEVINSDWVLRMQNIRSSHKLKPDHKHYFLQTYDDIFDVICSNYELNFE